MIPSPSLEEVMPLNHVACGPVMYFVSYVQETPESVEE